MKMDGSGLSKDDNNDLLKSLAPLFHIHALVLNADFDIIHASEELSALLSPHCSSIVGEHLNSYLNTDDFESLLDAIEQQDVDNATQLSLSKGQKIELLCQKIVLGGVVFIVATHFELIPEPIVHQPQLEASDVFAKLAFCSEGFEILSSNYLANSILELDTVIGLGFDQLINIKTEELYGHVALVHTCDFITIHTTITSNDSPVMIKISSSPEDRQTLIAFIVVTDHQRESLVELKHAQQVSASLFESRDCAMLMMDSFGVINRVNSRMSELLGDQRLVGKRAKLALPSQIVELVSTSETSSHDVELALDNQSHRMQLVQHPLRSAEGLVLGLLMTLSEPTDTTDSLKYRALYAASLAAEHAIFITNNVGKIIFVNEVFESQTGYFGNDVMDQDVSFIKNDTFGEENYRYLWKTVNNKDTWRGILRCKKQSGVSYWSDLVVNPLLDEDGNIECIVWLSQDITMDKELKRTGTYMANYDVVTGLANAVLAKDRLEGMIGRARRRKMIVAVIYLDISDFERLANRYSNHIIDGVLASYCERLRSALRSEDSLARMSNGRVAVLLPDLPNVAALEVVSAKIDQVNQQPVQVADTIETLEIKQGLSYYPEQGTSAESLFKNAEASLLKAWSSHNPIGCFGQSYNKKALTHFKLRRELVDVIKNQDLEVVYQPICAVGSDQIFSIEANIRWHHQKYGLIDNDEIYTLAEANGCVAELGYLLIEKIANDLAQWQQDGFSDFKVGINLSHGQFRNRQLAKDIANILSNHSLSIARLAFEIPISHIATQWLDLDNILQELSLMGASLQYDKFGERGAYISDLHHFPFDGIKLSQDFIEKIDTDPTIANLVQGIIAMAVSLNLKVTAVGVGDLSQLLQLQEMNCNYAQGDFFNGFGTKQELSNYFIREVGQPKVLELD